MISLLNWMCIM